MIDPIEPLEIAYQHACDENERLRAAAQNVLEWYDRDGSVGGLVDPIEELREVLQDERQERPT